MDLDGLVFFDTCPSGFGARTDRPSMPNKGRHSVSIHRELSPPATSEEEDKDGGADPDFSINMQEGKSPPFGGILIFTHSGTSGPRGEPQMCERLGESAKEVLRSSTCHYLNARFGNC